MIVYAITIESVEKGIAINCFNVQKSKDAAENAVAGLLDTALATGTQFIASEISKINNIAQYEIAGANIGKRVEHELSKLGAVNLRKALQAYGVIPLE